jgi:hypothetical protein
MLASFGGLFGEGTLFLFFGQRLTEKVQDFPESSGN